jgi:hypothetical protein
MLREALIFCLASVVLYGAAGFAAQAHKREQLVLHGPIAIETR